MTAHPNETLTHEIYWDMMNSFEQSFPEAYFARRGNGIPDKKGNKFGWSYDKPWDIAFEAWQTAWLAGKASVEKP